MKNIYEFLLSKNNTRKLSKDSAIKLGMDKDIFRMYIEDNGAGFIPTPSYEEWNNDEDEFKVYTNANYISIHKAGEKIRVNAIFNDYDKLIKCRSIDIDENSEAEDIEIEDLIEYVDSVIKN